MNQETKSDSSRPPAVTGSSSNRELHMALKMEFARKYVACLSDVLIWFLFSATSEERNQFREELGGAWQGFLDLTRAMTGETAFKIANEEGRLERWQR